MFAVIKFVGDGRVIVAEAIKGSPCKYVRELTPSPESPTGWYATDSAFINVSDPDWALTLFEQGAR